MKHTIVKNTFILCLSAALLFIAAGESSQVSKKYKAFFACSHTGTSFISADSFIYLMQLPLCARDSNNVVCKIKSFEIIYAERGLYQDDEGLPIIHTDYTNERFEGDTINSYWKKNFTNSIYKGDTIIFDNVICVNKDKHTFLCPMIKMVIK